MVYNSDLYIYANPLPSLNPNSAAVGGKVIVVTEIVIVTPTAIHSETPDNDPQTQTHVPLWRVTQPTLTKT